MKIYTKTGDTGQTSLIGGIRVSKANIRIESYGTLDELNSYIGLVADQEVNHKRREVLKEIQDRLFTIGSHLALGENSQKKLPDLFEKDVEYLEKEIDLMNEELPAMRYFILPGGHAAVSFCHVARCVCRRAERLVVAFNEEEQVEEIILKYLNRLSDYLFVLARKMGQELGINEISWKPRK